jgi:hypothetical protein
VEHEATSGIGARGVRGQSGDALCSVNNLTRWQNVKTAPHPPMTHHKQIGREYEIRTEHDPPISRRERIDVKMELVEYELTALPRRGVQCGDRQPTKSRGSLTINLLADDEGLTGLPPRIAC